MSGSLQWQLLDEGTPMRGFRNELVHLGTSGATYLWQGSQRMPPQLWRRLSDRWQRRLDLESMPRRSGPAIAYDARRQRIVYFGGLSLPDTASSETWEFDGIAWGRRDDVGAPTPRSGGEMAYDSERHVLVLFGGNAQGGVMLNDTWEYDGLVWRAINVPTPRPPARYGHCMAYDAERRRVVVAFGSSSTIPLMNDTWEYDGVRWVKAPAQPTLLPRSVSGCAYDPIRRRVYVFGGNGGGGETRAWTGSTWELVSTAVTPPYPRLGAAMTFDALLGESILYGGNSSDFGGFGDSWKFDGTRWEQMSDPVTSPHRYRSSVTFDLRVERPIVYGGTDFPRTLDETWERVGSEWQGPQPGLNPGRRDQPSAAYDPALGRAVAGFGFEATLNSCVATSFSYDASAHEWTELFGTSPPARCDAEMVYSDVHGGLVLFGGVNNGMIEKSDTWLRTTAGWEQLPATGAPLRSLFAMTYDSLRGEIVVYGGYNGALGVDETWVLRGLTWVQLPVSGPGRREDPAMAYDPIRGVSVLVGGDRRDTTDEDTWLFDGVAWHAVSTVYKPDMFRNSPSMTWDPVHAVVLLAAGSPDGLDWHYNDLWAFGWDADDDLKVGGFDNCPDVSNSDQLDGDADGAGDVCDCAPSDPTMFTVPPEVESLRFEADRVTLTWTSIKSASGSSSVHDIVRGSLASLPVGRGAEACIGLGLDATELQDYTGPDAGAGTWYLARGRNGCGVGSYGSDSSGAPRVSTACP